MAQEVGPGKEPTTTEDVEDVEDREVDNPRMRPPFAAVRSGPLEGNRGAEDKGMTRWGAGEGMTSEEDMVVRDRPACPSPYSRGLREPSGFLSL